MRFSKLIPILSVLAVLPACGTVIGNQTQEITLLTPGAWEAECTLDNGTKYQMMTGETRRIQRTYKPLKVDCYAPGNRHQTKTIGSGINEWTYANVANGVVPGVAYDAVSNGLYEYPSTITVDFVGVPTLGYELPDYHNKDVPSPYDQAIEDYGPNTLRVPEDNKYMKRGVERRDGGADSNPFGSTRTESVTPMPNATSTTTVTKTTTTVTAPVPSGRTAEELNRTMNPTVFNK